MTRPSRGRIRTNDPVGMRAKVLDAAAASFQSRGYRGSSMQDLVSAAGVTGGALHHHFPTKRDLAHAVITERVAAEIASTWIDVLVAAPTAMEGILQVFDGVAAGLEARGSVSGCPLGNLALELALADEALRQAIAGEYHAWREAVAAALRRDVEAGLTPFAASDVDGFADTVVAMATGALAVAKAEQDPRPIRACARTLRHLAGSSGLAV